MFKKPTRKQFIIRRVILSSLATAAVAIIVTIAVLSMLGYRLNSNNGTLQQGALLQFDSRPNGADAYVDDRQVGGRTATKQAVVAGTHTVVMKKAGYEDWSRTLTIEPGTLTWLNYTRLVPTERKPQTVAQYGALTQLEFSPDLKWAVAHEAAHDPSFHSIDLRSETVKSQLLTLPTTLYSEPDVADAGHVFGIVRWNTPSRHVLISHEFSGKREWIVLDTQDVARSVNVTRLLNVDFKDLQFAGTNGSSLYGLTNDGVIRKLDLGAGSMSRAFVTNVERFQMYSTKVLVYNGTNPDKPETHLVGVYRDGDEASSVLREVKKDVPLSIATSEYFGSDYVAIAEGSRVTVLKGAYPSAQAQNTITSLKQFATFSTAQAVDTLSFSPSGEYVAAQAGGQLATYEIEYKRSSTAARDTSRPLLWLDAAHLWTDASDTLRMRDFDGTNTQAIMPVAVGFDATLSQNGRFMYAVAKTDKGLGLQRVRMILE